MHRPAQATPPHCVPSALRAGLADYKVPETFTWRDTPLPRNANGKLMKRVLREELASALPASS